CRAGATVCENQPAQSGGQRRNEPGRVARGLGIIPLCGVVTPEAAAPSEVLSIVIVGLTRVKKGSGKTVKGSSLRSRAAPRSTPGCVDWGHVAALGEFLDGDRTRHVARAVPHRLRAHGA